MSRKRTNYTPEEKLEMTIQEINELENKLQELKDLKIKLEEEVNHKRLEQLDELIRKSGKSFDEITMLLNV